MAEEKKPSLKDRLAKKTQVGGPAAAEAPPAAQFEAPAGFDAPAPVSSPFGGDFGGPAAPTSMPGIPGFDDGVAPPPFVAEQQARDAAARAQQAQAAAHAAKVAQAASDPFGASSFAAPSPQEVRLVIDEKPVDEAEIGRSRRPAILAVVIASVVALGAGFLLGGQREVSSQEAATRTGVTAIREDLNRLGATIAAAKTNADRAFEAAGLAATADTPVAQRHAARMDPGFNEWMTSQLGTQQDPPFSANVYASRVGRLRGDVVAKLAQLTLGMAELWRQMGVHVQRTNVAAITAAIDASDDRVFVTFNRMAGQGGAAGPLVAQVVNGTPTPNTPNVVLTGANIPANTSRALYRGESNLTAEQLATATMLVNVRDGIGPDLLRSARGPVLDYVERVRQLKALIDQIAETHRQVTTMLGGSAAPAAS